MGLLIFAIEKRKLTIPGMIIGILGLLCACTLRSDKRISEEKIDVRREVNN